MYRILIRPLGFRDEEDEAPQTEEEKAPKTEKDKKTSEKRISPKILMSIILSNIAEGITDFISTKPNFLTRLFMLYDCQPYSSNLARKLIKSVSMVSKNSFSLNKTNENEVVVQDSVKSQIRYLEIMSNFLKKLNIKPISKEAQEKIKFLLTNKNKIYKVEKSLKEKGRKGVKASIQNHVGEEPNAISAKLAEFLLYSRRIPVEAVLELIGHKEEIDLLIGFMQQFEPLMTNLNVEQSLRKFFTSFRLAGVESQVVERVLENFGKFYYKFHKNFDSEEGVIKFVTEKESFEFVYLLLMLHTCHHNPNIENKTNFKWYVDSVKDMCKESFQGMQEKDLKNIFESVEIFEFDSPTTRFLFDKKFSTESLPIELYTRTRISNDVVEELKDSEFIN